MTNSNISLSRRSLLGAAGGAGALAAAGGASPFLPHLHTRPHRKPVLPWPGRYATRSATSKSPRFWTAISM
ncbi:twin-arginine translocation signal domain-containing protein [Roseibium salinum]|nr:twin-arginine translocation signal domain-containing protein [Roseibium salinum]